MNLEVVKAGTDMRTGASHCRFCAAPLSETLVNLGMSPLCETFLLPRQLDEMEPYYPLHVLVCGRCHLAQLGEYVRPEEIFTEYAYFSSYSTSWVEHARRYCLAMKERFGLGADSLVVELASNDGYLLQHFGPLGVPALGVEPAANVAAAAREKGVDTLVAFFGVALAQKLAAEGRKADLIAGNNVLAQVPDINDFVGGIRLLLKDEGVVTLEFPHLLELMRENQFDTIYHEHFSYFSLLAIENIAGAHGLRVFDIETLPTHGGSLRVFLCHAGAAHAPVQANLQRLRDAEQEAALRDMAAYRAFAEQVHATKRRLLAALIAIKDEGKRICGYGAPGKGNTLLNFCAIGTDFLDFTVDRNPYKHGRFTPGMHIPIHPVEAIDKARPDYVLILPWNLKKEIVAQMARIGDWGGKFIIPIPTVHVIDPREIER